MNAMHLNSILFILSVIYSLSASLNAERNGRVRREEQKYVQTTCILIDSIAKERCTTHVTEHSTGHATQTESCVFDENFRVKYQTVDGKNVRSTIETFGRSFPRLMKVS
jgi:hypothetical protein